MDIIQDDREMAALIAENIGTYGFDGNDVAAIRNGIWDDGELGQIVQLVSRHRLAHTARPAAPQGEEGSEVERLRAAAQAVLANASRPGSRMHFTNDGDIWIDHKEVNQSVLDQLAAALAPAAIASGREGAE